MILFKGWNIKQVGPFEVVQWMTHLWNDDFWYVSRSWWTDNGKARFVELNSFRFLFPNLYISSRNVVSDFFYFVTWCQNEHFLPSFLKVLAHMLFWSSALRFRLYINVRYLDLFISCSIRCTDFRGWLGWQFTTVPKYVIYIYIYAL